LPNNTLIFAKRSLNLSKIYSGMGIFFASFGIFIADAITFFAKGAPEAVFLIAVPFMVLGFLFSLHLSFCFTSMTKTTAFWSIYFHSAGIKATSLNAT
jgi:hypothetical protein